MSDCVGKIHRISTRALTIWSLPTGLFVHRLLRVVVLFYNCPRMFGANSGLSQSTAHLCATYGPGVPNCCLNVLSKPDCRSQSSWSIDWAKVMGRAPPRCTSKFHVLMRNAV